jgi:hypothetical protein
MSIETLQRWEAESTMANLAISAMEAKPEKTAQLVSSLVDAALCYRDVIEVSELGRTPVEIARNVLIFQATKDLRVLVFKMSPEEIDPNEDFSQRQARLQSNLPRVLEILEERE